MMGLRLVQPWGWHLLFLVDDFAVTFVTNVNVPLRINFNKFDGPLTFHQFEFV